jgi:anti-anti-sigma factor
MSIEDWSKNIVLVDLPCEPDSRGELDRLIRHIRDRRDCDVVIDLSNVGLLTSASLGPLVCLNKLLQDSGRKLSLCCVAPATRGVFSITGLDGLFEIFESRFDALATVRALPGGETPAGEKTS